MAEGSWLSSISPETSAALARLLALPRPRCKGHLSIFHRDAKRHFGAGSFQLFHLALYQVRKAMEGHRFLADRTSRLDHRVVKLVQLVHLFRRIAERGDAQDLVFGFLRRGRRGRTLMRERTGTSFFARAQAAVPQIGQRCEARLQCREAEPVAVVLDVGAI